MGLLVPGCCAGCSSSFPAPGAGARSCLYGHSQRHHEPHPVPVLCHQPWPHVCCHVPHGASTLGPLPHRRLLQAPGICCRFPTRSSLLHLGWRRARILHALGIGARISVDEAAHGPTPRSHREPPPQGDGALPPPAVQVRFQRPLGAEREISIFAAGSISAAASLSQEAKSLLCKCPAESDC